MEKKKVVAIAAGKGGVGKSLVTVQLARYLIQKGKSVGILDADLYGPSIEKMLTQDHGVTKGENGVVPARCEGISVISISHFNGGKGASVVRAPIANELIGRFLHDVEWGDLDYLLIDFPPGTGDIPLTLMQAADLSGALLVTLPSQISLLDVEKAHQMFHQGQVPIIGLVENMSYIDEGEKRIYPFGKGGGRLFAEEREIPFLGGIPLDRELSRCADFGRRLETETSATIALEELGANFEEHMVRLLSDEGLKDFELIW